MPNSIFVNYRRSDSHHAAIAIASVLRFSFVEEEVFIDRCSINAGESWPERIRNAVDQAEVMVVVIGKNWLRVVDEYGRRRIDHPHDWVRLELSRAFARKIPVLPVLLDDADVPPKEALDCELEELCDAQVSHIRLDSWDKDLGGLFERLKQITGAKPRTSPAFPNGIPIPRPSPAQRGRRALTQVELAQHLLFLSCWREESNYHDWAIGGESHEIARAYEFPTFERAMDFMQFASHEIDRWEPQHHPRWENQWRSVKVWFTTWDVGCRVTELYIETARKLDAIFVRFTV
jgi:pterin-4a-carbinolamine dehydratase